MNIIKNKTLYILKTSLLQWGKVLESQAEIINNEKNEKYEKNIIEIAGNKNLFWKNHKNVYTLVIDMREYKKIINKEYIEYNNKSYYLQIKKFIN